MRLFGQSLASGSTEVVFVPTCQSLSNVQAFKPQDLQTSASVPSRGGSGYRTVARCFCRSASCRHALVLRTCLSSRASAHQQYTIHPTVTCFRSAQRRAWSSKLCKVCQVVTIIAISGRTMWNAQKSAARAVGADAAWDAGLWTLNDSDIWQLKYETRLSLEGLEILNTVSDIL